MNHKWIQRRKCGILTSSGWATIWATKIKILLTFARQWAAVNSEFRPLSSRFEAPSFIIWLPGSWVYFPYHLGMIPECASTLVLPQNTLASPFISSISTAVHCPNETRKCVREERRRRGERGGKMKKCCVFFQFRFWLCLKHQMPNELHLFFISKPFDIMSTTHITSQSTSHITSLFKHQSIQSIVTSLKVTWFDAWCDTRCD